MEFVANRPPLTRVYLSALCVCVRSNEILTWRPPSPVCFSLSEEAED